jgi:hypothetical protein
MMNVARRIPGIELVQSREHAMNVSVILGLVGVSVSLLFAVSSGRAEGAEPRLAHAVYFTLKDHSPEAREKFVASCQKYLTNHPGLVSFSVGMIAEDVVEGPSVRDFDVAIHLVFENKSFNATYQASKRHVAFVEENKANFAKVRVFDTYLAQPKAGDKPLE